MIRRFDGQVVFITGATSGIGLSTARRFKREGAHVVGTGRDPARLDALGAEIDLAVCADVRSETDVDRAIGQAIERFGHIDIVVNNAGIGLFEPWTDTPVPEVQRILEVNLHGAIRVTQRALPAMIQRKRGIIVNIASVAGKRGYPNHTAYCASKHALIGYGEALRCELAGTGVSVVTVCPPAVRTPFFENSGYMTFDADHPGFVPMSAEDAAAGIVDATARRKRTQVLSSRAQVLYALSVLSPGLVDGLRRLKAGRLRVPRP